MLETPTCRLLLVSKLFYSKLVVEGNPRPKKLQKSNNDNLHLSRRSNIGRGSDEPKTEWWCVDASPKCVVHNKHLIDFFILCFSIHVCIYCSFLILYLYYLQVCWLSFVVFIIYFNIFFIFWFYYFIVTPTFQGGPCIVCYPPHYHGRYSPSDAAPSCIVRNI